MMLPAVVPEPLTTQATDLREIWWIFLIAGGVVALIVYGLLAFAIVRYRRRDDLLPPQVHQRLGIEITYTVIPLLVVAGLVVITLGGISVTEALAAEPDVVVDVTGSQWQWEFEYQATDMTGGGDLHDVPELVLPVDSTVRFNVTSGDVIHSFWVPGFFFKRDLIPGEVQTFDVNMGDETGTFTGKCAEFCGLEHFAMTFTLRIVSAEEFTDWVQQQ